MVEDVDLRQWCGEVVNDGTSSATSAGGTLAAAEGGSAPWDGWGNVEVEGYGVVEGRTRMAPALWKTTPHTLLCGQLRAPA